MCVCVCVYVCVCVCVCVYVYMYIYIPENIHFIDIFCPKAIFHLREHEILSKKIKKTA